MSGRLAVVVPEGRARCRQGVEACPSSVPGGEGTPPAEGRASVSPWRKAEETWVRLPGQIPDLSFPPEQYQGEHLGGKKRS